MLKRLIGRLESIEVLVGHATTESRLWVRFAVIAVANEEVWR